MSEVEVVDLEAPTASHKVIIHKEQQATQTGIILMEGEGGPPTITDISPDGAAAEHREMIGSELLSVAGMPVTDSETGNRLLQEAEGQVELLIKTPRPPQPVATAAPEAEEPELEVAVAGQQLVANGGETTPGGNSVVTIAADEGASRQSPSGQSPSPKPRPSRGDGDKPLIHASTTTFGSIRFPTRVLPAKYVCVAPDSEAGDLVSLLIDTWKLVPPCAELLKSVPQPPSHRPRRPRALPTQPIVSPGPLENSRPPRAFSAACSLCPVLVFAQCDFAPCDFATFLHQGAPSSRSRRRRSRRPTTSTPPKTR